LFFKKEATPIQEADPLNKEARDHAAGCG
jgi:hypothetical protein